MRMTFGMKTRLEIMLSAVRLGLKVALVHDRPVPVADRIRQKKDA